MGATTVVLVVVAIAVKRMQINDDDHDDDDDGGINMILAAFAIWSLMKRKFSRVVTVAVVVGIVGKIKKLVGN